MRIRFESISARQRVLVLITLDSVISFISLFAAIVFKYSFFGALIFLKTRWWVLVLSVLLRVGTFQNYGLYVFLWRYASIKELMSLTRAVTLSSVFLTLLVLLIPGQPFPKTIFFVDWALTLIGVGTARICIRIVRELVVARQVGQRSAGTRTIIVGAGDAGEMIAREMLRVPTLSYDLVGFVDDNIAKQGQNIHQIPVLGGTEDLATLIEQYDLEAAILAIPSASGKEVRRIVDVLEKSKLTFKIAPALHDIIDGRISFGQLRDVSIEDLLGRDVVTTDTAAISRYISGKSVLVTGAGGSIGSELCRQIAGFSPRQLILLDHAENSVYQIDLELREKPSGNTVLIPIVADIKNRSRLDEVFKKCGIDIVFHAAAYKHVPLMEANMREVILNNIAGTRNLIDLADQYQIDEFVLISTDKAVNSTNCMGASKRICELLLQAKDQVSKTRFAAVRFGNVLGSAGSVVPLFKRQIAVGGPITVTHPDVIRYFMTIPEAVRLVLQAGAQSMGGEIFILDMGEPVKIVNLAKDMIRLSGFEEGKDIEIKYIGLRPGEKMFEELVFSNEEMGATDHGKIFRTRPSVFDRNEVSQKIDALIASGLEADESDLRLALFDIIRAIEVPV